MHKTWDDYYEIVCNDDMEGEFRIEKQEQDKSVIFYDLQEPGRMMNSKLDKTVSNAIYKEANGDILMAGLGIAYEQYVLCHEDNVKSITSVECEQDVITMINRYFTHQKHTVINDRILHFMQTTDQKFDTIYFDIFPDDPKHFPTETQTLTDVATPLLNRNGRILFWTLFRPLNL